MSDEWELHDYTNGKTSGYLQLTKGGIRVADFFPYSKDANEQWVRQQAAHVHATMMAVDGGHP